MSRWIKIEFNSPEEPEPAPEGVGAGVEAGPDDVQSTETEVQTINAGPFVAIVIVLVVIGVLWLTRDQWTVLLPGATAGTGTGTGDTTEATGGPGAVGSGETGAAELLATVNGQEITSADVDLELAIQKAIQAQMGLVMDEDPVKVRAFRRDILDRVVDQALLFSAASSAGIIVSDDEVVNGLPLLGQRLGVDGNVIYEAALAGGISETQYTEWVRRQLAVERYSETDEARRLGMEQMAERGYPVDPNVPPPVDPGTVATALQADADVVFIVGGEPVAPARIGDVAPDFALVGLDGETVTLSELRGRPVLVNFWATWCGPCKIEMPILQQTYERYGDDLVVLGIDVQEPLELVTQYVSSNRLSFPTVLDQDGQVATLYRVRGLPMSYFIDAEGVIVDSHRGAIRSAPELEPYLEQVLPSAQGMVR